MRSSESELPKHLPPHLAEHAKRLDPGRYSEHATRPLLQSLPRVAVIGAGISGLICARRLLDHGVQATVLEKGRGVGGRMATRQTNDGLQFDHGAQYFTVRDAGFERYVRSWIQDGIAAPWEGRIATLAAGQVEWKQNTTPRFVGVPRMSAICRHLAAELRIEFGTTVAPPEEQGGVWRLADERGAHIGEFDCVVVSAPAPQAARLLAAAPVLQQRAEATNMNGCWAAMLAFDSPLELTFDGAFVHESPLSWIARNNAKPQRGGDRECWVLHASPQWTMQHLEQSPDAVLPRLMDAFWQATGLAPRTPSFATSHRWRYAIPPEPLEERCLFDAERNIAACGDWCSGPRVEGAFLSGMAVAGRVLAQLAKEGQTTRQEPTPKERTPDG